MAAIERFSESDAKRLISKSQPAAKNGYMLTSTIPLRGRVVTSFAYNREEFSVSFGSAFRDGKAKYFATLSAILRYEKDDPMFAYDEWVLAKATAKTLKMLRASVDQQELDRMLSG